MKPLLAKISLILSIAFLLSACGYPMIQYEFEPNVKLQFTVEERLFESINGHIIALGKKYDNRPYVLNAYRSFPKIRSVKLLNKNMYITASTKMYSEKSSMEIFSKKRELLTLRIFIHKSRIPGLRPNKAELSAVIRDFVDTLSAVDGIEFIGIEDPDDREKFLDSDRYGFSPDQSA